MDAARVVRILGVASLALAAVGLMTTLLQLVGSGLNTVFPGDAYGLMEGQLVFFGLAHLLLAFAGVGLLQSATWARTTTLFYAGYRMVLFLLFTGMVASNALPLLFASGAGAAEMGALSAASQVLMSAKSLMFPILLLVLMVTPAMARHLVDRSETGDPAGHVDLARVFGPLGIAFGTVVLSNMAIAQVLLWRMVAVHGATVADGGFRMVLLPIAFLSGVGYIASGIGLMGRLPWARPVAMASGAADVLVTLIALGTTIFLMLFHSYVGGRGGLAYGNWLFHVVQQVGSSIYPILVIVFMWGLRVEGEGEAFLTDEASQPRGDQPA